RSVPKVAGPAVAILFPILIALTISIVGSYSSAMTRPILGLDESAYLSRGVALVEHGEMTSIPLSPGVSLIHAASYLFTRNNPLGVYYTGQVTAFLGHLVVYFTIFLAARSLLGTRWGFITLCMSLLYEP